MSPNGASSRWRATASSMFRTIRAGRCRTGAIPRCDHDRLQGNPVREALSGVKRALILLRRRAISSIPVLLIVVIFSFFLLESASGDAVDAYLGSIGGGDAALIKSLRESYGLD